MAGKKRQRRSAFVPKLLVKTAIASVVPACALGCGGEATSNIDAGADSPFYGVAAVGYPAYDASRDVKVQDAGQDVFFSSVSSVAYPAYEAGSDSTGPDGKFGVAAVAYPAYEAGKG